MTTKDLTSREKQEALLAIAGVVNGMEDEAARNGGYASKDREDYCKELSDIQHKLYNILWEVA